MTRSINLGTKFWPLDDIDVRVGNNIRFYRKNIGITRQSLSEELGLTIHQIKKIENGKRHINPRELILLADFLCIEPLNLFDEIPIKRKM